MTRKPEDLHGTCFSTGIGAKAASAGPAAVLPCSRGEVLRGFLYSAEVQTEDCLKGDSKHGKKRTRSARSGVCPGLRKRGEIFGLLPKLPQLQQDLVLPALPVRSGGCVGKL